MQSTLSPIIWQEIHAHRKSMTRIQQQRFLEELQQAPPRLQALGWLLFYGALRISEVRQVRRDHICNLLNFVAVCSAKRRNAAVGRPKWRTIPLPRHVIEALLSLTPRQHDLLFPEHRTTLLRWIKPLLEAAGCTGPAATTRAFRHSYRDRAEKQNHPVSVTANQLGHTERTDRLHYGDPMGYELTVFAEATWELRC